MSSSSKPAAEADAPYLPAQARPDAIHFYQHLGFVASHEGLKLDRPADPPA